jgi:hypothetical protein
VTDDVDEAIRWIEASGVKGTPIKPKAVLGEKPPEAQDGVRERAAG